MVPDPNELWWSRATICPRCGQDLDWRESRATCASCAFHSTSQYDVPVLTSTPDEHKAQQARFFDEADEEFETTRPHGTPALYRWLLEEKFRRSLASLTWLFPGATVLTVCGGSGMEAEMLARRGGRVLVSDLSAHAAARAVVRGRRFGAELDAVAVDAESLPFADRAFDLVYVHDGLHHLQDPLVGLAEMARVARRAVSVNEPALARATEIAIRLRAAARVEDAGNVIARVDPGVIAERLAAAGFRVLRSERYGMYYKHEPGAVMRALSAPPLFHVTTTGIRAFNAVLSAIGNKSTVQAVRATGG